jgi:Ca2+-binding EF-hand superfamily protein
MDELNMNLIFQKMGDELGVKLENVASSKDRFKSFEMTAQRRRVLKKKMEEDMKSNLATLVTKLCELLNRPVPDAEGRKLFQTMVDTFNAFDNDGSAALNFSEFKEAWRFLQKPGDDNRIKAAFDNQDIDGSGHVDQNEFAFALMGEQALKYGVLADMELLNSMLVDVSGNMMASLASGAAATKTVEQQANENEALRQRLETMKASNDAEMQRMMSKISGLAGLDAIKMMSEADMDQILTDVFNKFDVDGSGTMELPEFKVAWKRELNLGGSDSEISRSFMKVDVDNSGVIELNEFKKAIKGERLAELNMKVIAQNMEGTIDSLAKYMKKFQDDYKNALATAKRRRAMRTKFVNRLMQRSNELMEKLEGVNSDAQADKDTEGASFYKQLNETFDAFDKDGSGELAFPEYTAAWRFLNQPGSSTDIRNAFNSVDVDRSGLVDRDEFILSIMGPKANDFGPIADMDRLDSLMDGLLALIERHGAELADLSKSGTERDAENARILARMKNQKNQLSAGMSKIMKSMMGLTGNDIEGFLQSKEVDRYLVEAFNKYDRNGNGTLSAREFAEAWKFMNLGGNEAEIRDAFTSVDVDYSGVIEYSEFAKAIKESRLSELGITAVMSSIGVELDGVLAKFERDRGSFDAMKSTMRRRAQRAREMQENIAKLLAVLLEKVIDKTEGHSVIKRDPQKQQLYNDLNDTFKAFDRDNNATLQFPEYNEAWRFLNLPGDQNAAKEAFDKVDIDRSGNVDLEEFLYSIMGEDAKDYGYFADLEVLEALLAKLVAGDDKKALESLNRAQKTNEAKDIQIQQLQAELERIRNSEGGSTFNDLVQRMMFKCGVTRIGPLTGEELTNEVDAAFASAAAGGIMDRKTFHEVVNSKKMMEMRLRKLIAEIQADYYMESKAPYGLDDEEVSGRDLTASHTAEEALHLRSFLRTSALVIQFCRRIQLKFSHADVEGAVKAAKALSHLLIRSQEELYEEIQRVKTLSTEKRYGSRSYGSQGRGSRNL